MSGAQTDDISVATASAASEPSPEIADLLARAFGIDLAALERDVAQILDEAGAMGQSLIEELEGLDLWSWLMAASITALAVEIIRRDSRRAKLEVALAWGDAFLMEVEE